MNNDFMSGVQQLATKKAVHNSPAYSKISLLMGCGIQIRGDGCYVDDHRGKRYLDMFDAYGNQTFGYSHPGIVRAIQEQLNNGNLNSCKVMFEEDHIVLTERLSALTNDQLPYVYFANGGAESIDSALKIARSHTRREKFITAKNCFHGKTFAALSAACRPEYEEAYRPLMNCFESVEFNNIEALRAAIDQHTAAVLLEPIQAEGGVFVPTAQYMQEVRQLCTERGALLIVDEMQTAFGRTGTFFAFEQFDIVPDIICIGKAFGGGVVPLSAILARANLWGVHYRVPSSFGSSLAGAPLASKVGLTTLALGSDEVFLKEVRRKSSIVTAALARLPEAFPSLLSAHRGMGMLHGLEFRNEGLIGLALRLLYQRGVLSTFSLYNVRVMRFQPPLVASEDELALGLQALHEVLTEVDEYRDMVGDDNIEKTEIRFEYETAHGMEAVSSLMQDSPHSLDPFSVNNESTEMSNEVFAGTLGDDPIVWNNRITRESNTIQSRSASPAMWDRLERDVVMAPGRRGTGTTSITVDIRWAAGAGYLEPLLATRIGYFVRMRMSDLFATLDMKLSAK